MGAPVTRRCKLTSHRLSAYQGAERKTRDEERRAAKRKMTATGRKKLDELYHSVTERSEFYSMVDLHKPPVLFSPPAEHTIDKVVIESPDSVQVKLTPEAALALLASLASLELS